MHPAMDLPSSRLCHTTPAAYASWLCRPALATFSAWLLRSAACSMMPNHDAADLPSVLLCHAPQISADAELGIQHSRPRLPPLGQEVQGQHARAGGKKAPPEECEGEEAGSLLYGQQ